MKKFRIQINELNNGKKEYTPQVGIPRLHIGRYCHLGITWYNILSDSYSFSISSTTKYIYPNEDKALEVIEEYKKYLDHKELKQTKTISYKEIQ
jgi:hypothetical protein